MTREEKDKLSQLLHDAADEIWEQEYSSWWNANTMRSWEDWFSGSTQELHQKLQAEANVLDQD